MIFRDRVVLTAMLVFWCIVLLGAYMIRPYDRVHKATHHLDFGSWGCSGTTVGPHAVFTATHCVSDTPQAVIIDDEPAAREVVKVMRDGNDNTLVMVGGEPMTDIVAIHPDLEFRTGDEFFFWGNPGDLHDVLRFGRFAGMAQVEGMKEKGYLLDATSWFGDSGSGIFNSDGKLVGGVSKLHWQLSNEYPPTRDFIVIFPIRFTPAQLKEATQ